MEASTVADDQHQQQGGGDHHPTDQPLGSSASTKAAMKEVLTELLSEVPGFKELMEKPPIVPTRSHGSTDDRTKSMLK